MKLIDLMNVLDKNSSMRVCDINGILCRYDGKDSIDVKYHGREVIKIIPIHSSIFVIVRQ
jgi:hypothetical protein